MKKAIIIALFFMAFKASAQIAVPAENADRYTGQTVSAFGYVYKIKALKGSKDMLVYFGSKYSLKGIILKIKDESKLKPDCTFRNLNDKFITVTGKINQIKGKYMIDGDNPNTSINIRVTLAEN